MGIVKKRVLILFILLAFSSCAEVKPRPVSEGSRDSAIAQEISKEVWQFINAQSYRKALDTYSAASSRYPRNAELRGGYIRTVDHMRDLADAAFRKEDFTSAGHIYSVLLKSDIRKDVAAVLSLNDGFLAGQIKKCSKALTEKGVNKYREGRLEDAISIWKGIIEFDPDNKEIKDAISIATVQLENLRRIN
jgi:tetratricopeptide (TPR) repeat protein